MIPVAVLLAIAIAAAATVRLTVAVLSHRRAVKAATIKAAKETSHATR